MAAKLLKQASSALKEYGLQGLRESLIKVMRAAKTD